MTDFTLGPGPLIPEFEQIKSDIGIVENGNTATHAIPSGYYVIWKGDLYVAKTDISIGTTLSAASGGNLTAKTNGIGGEVAENSQAIKTVDYGQTLADQAALEAALVTLGDSISNGEFRNIRFSITVSSGAFAKSYGYYIGTIKRTVSGRYLVEVQCDRKSTTTACGNIITGVYYNSAWTWRDISEEVTSNSTAITHIATGHLTNDVLADALNITQTTLFTGSGNSYTGTVPSANMKYGVFIAYKRSSNIFVKAIDPTGKTYINSYNQTWTGWHELASITKHKVTVTLDANGSAVITDYNFDNVISVNGETTTDWFPIIRKTMAGGLLVFVFGTNFAKVANQSIDLAIWTKD